MRVEAEGMPTRSSISTARANSALGGRRSCARIVSMSWSPMLNTGFRLVIGSWKTMAMPGPRMPCMRDCERVVSSVPSNRMEPPAMRAGGRGSRPMMVSAVTLLPEPDSPTMPRISPGSRLKEMSSTAVISPRWVWKAVVRFWTSSNGIRRRDLEAGCHGDRTCNRCRPCRPLPLRHGRARPGHPSRQGAGGDGRHGGRP